MAITTRGGPKADFDPNKMLTKEPATITDDRKIVWCVAPGDVRTLATVEDMAVAISEADQIIVDELTAGANASANVIDGVLSGINHIIDTDGTYYQMGSESGELFLHEIAPDPTPPVSQTILDDIVDLQDNKLDKANVSQVIENDANTVPSSAVTYALGLEIDDINSSLAASTQIIDLSAYTAVTWFTAPKAIKRGNEIEITGITMYTTGLATGTTILSLPANLKPVVAQTSQFVGGGFAPAGTIEDAANRFIPITASVSTSGAVTVSNAGALSLFTIHISFKYKLI